MVVLLGCALAVAALLGVLGLRHRILLILALRNVPRRRAQTVLIVSGLMLSTAIITSQINDADTGTPVPNPKARVGDTQPGNGTTSGSMVIAPAPPAGTEILICAKDYAATTIKSGAANVTVTLKKTPGSDCPALPTPSPAPTPVGQTPAPSPSASPSPTPSPSPSP